MSHNALQGRDDLSVLMSLLTEISDVEDLIESAVDKDAIAQLASQRPIDIPDVAADYDWRVVQFVFLPTQMANLHALCDTLEHNAKTMIGVADRTAYEAFMETMKRLGKTENIRSVGAIVNRMVEITTQHLNTLDETPKAVEE